MYIVFTQEIISPKSVFVVTIVELKTWNAEKTLNVLAKAPDFMWTGGTLYSPIFQTP